MTETTTTPHDDDPHPGRQRTLSGRERRYAASVLRKKGATDGERVARVWRGQTYGLGLGAVCIVLGVLRAALGEPANGLGSLGVVLVVVVLVQRRTLARLVREGVLPERTPTRG